MALFDSLGNNDNPLFVGFKPSQGLDNRMALSYLDKKKSLKPDLGSAPKMENLDLEGLGADTYMLENEIMAGRGMVNKAIKKAGGNVAYAMNTDEYKAGMSHINATQSEINILKNQKKEKDIFSKKVEDDNVGSSFYVGDGINSAIKRIGIGQGYTNSEFLQGTEAEGGLDYRQRTERGMTFSGAFSAKEYADLNNAKFSQAVNSYNEIKNLGTTDNIDPSKLSSINDVAVLSKVTRKSGSKKNTEQIAAAQRVVEDMYSDEQLLQIHGNAYFKNGDVGGSAGKGIGIKSFRAVQEEFANKISNAVDKEEKAELEQEYFSTLKANFKAYATVQVAEEFNSRVRKSNESGATIDLEKFGESKYDGQGSPISKKISMYENMNDAARISLEINPTEHEKMQMNRAGFQGLNKFNEVDLTNGSAKSAGTYALFKNDAIQEELNGKIKRNTEGTIVDGTMPPEEEIYFIGANGETFKTTNSGVFNDDGVDKSQRVKYGSFTNESMIKTDADGRRIHLFKRAIYVPEDAIDDSDGVKEIIGAEESYSGNYAVSEESIVNDFGGSSLVSEDNVEVETDLDLSEGLIKMYVWVDKNIATTAMSSNATKHEKEIDVLKQANEKTDLSEALK